MLAYITSNKEKIESAKRNLAPLGISFDAKPLDLIEIQSESIEEIAESKAKQAFTILKEPLFVTDHGWSIRALKGFPGAYMKFANNWLSTQDFLNLMAPHDDKSITKKEVLCYIDAEGVKIFSSNTEGRFISEIRGDGLSAMRVVSMLPSGKSVAECIQEGIDCFANAHWREFASMYTSRTQ